MTQQITDELISINPATLEEVGRTPVTSPAELDRIVTRAHASFAQWRTDRAHRQKLLLECANELSRAADDLVPHLVREQGKTSAQAADELWISARHFSHAAELDWAEAELDQSAGGRIAHIQKRPLGAVAAIVPWNFPLFLTAAKIAPALAAGNTVVVKPAESVSLVVDMMASILNRILPAGVLGVVHGGPDTGSALVTHPLIRKVSFTGSTRVGTLIMAQAAQTPIPVTLELGGNDPAIVLEDADIASTARALARSAFYNTGQVCVAPKRAYVPASRIDEFCDVFAQSMETITVGDGMDPRTSMGPLHNRSQLDIVQSLLAAAVAGGATVVSGGGRGTDLPGHFLEPTLVRDLDDSFDLVSREQFGPVFPVVSYTDLGSVLDRLDSETYGLGASLWTTDDAIALSVSEQIDAGSIWINQHNAVEVELPFGGVKSSGFGREGGFAGISDYLQTTVVNLTHHA